MYINITGLIIWWVMAFIVAITSSLVKKENVWEFIERFSFIGFFDTLIFIFLTYIKVF
jgi:hypothetical protein